MPFPSAGNKHFPFYRAVSCLWNDPGIRTFAYRCLYRKPSCRQTAGSHPEKCAPVSPAIIKRCEIYGTGEYFDEEQNKEDLFGEILEHLTNEVLCKSFLIEFRNLENPLFGYKAFRRNNYFAINWLRVRNSLHSKTPYERLSMSRRRQINKALRNGAIMEIADNEKDIQDFSRMLKKPIPHR